MRTNVIPCLAALLSVLPTVLVAQALPMGQGSRVCVMSPRPFQARPLDNAVALGTAPPLPLIVQSNSQLGYASIVTVGAIRRRPTGKGALKGAGVGLLVGTALGGMVELFAAGDQAVAPAVGAVAGLGMGTIMGAGGRPAIVGGLAGLGIGGVAGAVIGLLVDEHGNDLAPSDAAAIGAGFFGVIGFAVGSIVGYASGEPTSASRDRLSLRAIARSDGHRGLAASLSF